MLANTAQKLFQWLPYLMCCNIPEDVHPNRTALSGSDMPGPNPFFLQSTHSSSSSPEHTLHFLPTHHPADKTSAHSKYRKNKGSLYSLNPQNPSSTPLTSMYTEDLPFSVSISFHLHHAKTPDQASFKLYRRSNFNPLNMCNQITHCSIYCRVWKCLWSCHKTFSAL